MKKMKYISTAVVFFCYAISASIMFLQSSRSLDIEKEHNLLLGEHIFDSVHEDFYKPILTSKVMASDSFLQDLLIHEEEMSEEEVTKELSAYLKLLREELHYSSSFVVSEKTHRYYTANGIEKVIDTQTSPYDRWYPLFVESNKTYDLDTDRDQANEYRWTVFVNIRVTAPDGSLLGVCGVGVIMSNLQVLLESFESQYNLKVNLVDLEGLVQVDTQTQDIENAYIAEAIKDNAPADRFIYSLRGPTGYRMTRYMDDLEWFLVIQGVNNQSKKVFSGFILMALACGITILLYLFMVNLLAKDFNKRKEMNLHEDPVTKLPSRDYLRDVFGENGVFNTTRFKSIVVFDVDSFSVQRELGNDTNILVNIGKYVSESFEWKGIVVRWSDDDFVALLEMTPEEAEAKFIEFSRMIKENLDITISVGISEINLTETVKVNYYRTVQKCYAVKEKGGDGVFRN
ncbi:MAG: diguanylate cyclase [Treponema sp.]|nr:diguanylate cyclase [Treponema sp.]